MPDLLIDTNILVLLVIGTWDRQAVPHHKRTAIFTPADYSRLRRELGRYRRMLTTQGVLTEASNLMGNRFHERVSRTMIHLCTAWQEVGPAKDVVLQDRGFPRLGFADASILASLAEGVVVLTDDVQLYNEVWFRNGEAVNFNHIRRSGKR
jgi:hypothetical protein